MISFVNAKINIGLQVIDKRPDGYHNLETVFYPVNIHDVLEIVESEQLSLVASGITIPEGTNGNLCLRAYDILRERFDLPAVTIYLHKVIPIGAGLGGGSADAAGVLKALNGKYALGISDGELISLASELGADCAFFIRNRPVFATGIGDVFEEISLDLSGYHIVVVKPDVHISTAEAYRSVKPSGKGKSLRSAIDKPVSAWKDLISNDFEEGLSIRYPEIGKVKSSLYDAGAEYAAMSGSGSAVFGLFRNEIKLHELDKRFPVFYTS